MYFDARAEKDKFQVLLRDLCKGIAEPEGAKTGRPRLPLADVVFAAAFKVYSTVSGGRFMSDLREAHEGGYVESDFAVDSSGITTNKFHRWFDHKYGQARQDTGRSGGAWAKMFRFFTERRDVFLAHYQKQSNVEMTFSMIKRKLGDAVRSKTDVAMMNEALCKALGADTSSARELAG